MSGLGHCSFALYVSGSGPVMLFSFILYLILLSLFFSSKSFKVELAMGSVIHS